MPRKYKKHRSVATGDVVLFAPAGPLCLDRIDQGLAVVRKECPKVAAVLKAVTVEATAPFPWLYRSDKEQADGFSKLMQEPGVAFAWALRGGYGILRWIDRVCWDFVSSISPVVVGFSDVTLLHAVLNARKVSSLHAPMLCTLHTTAEQSRSALWEYFDTGRLPLLEGGQCVAGQGTVTGRLIGGNLCCLTHLIGTAFEPSWEHSILLLEDVNEPLYKVDRMLTHLLQSHRLDTVAGIVVGEFTGTGESDVLLLRLLEDRLGGLGVPVVCGFPVGHGENNMPLLLGTTYTLDAQALTLVPHSGL